MNPHERNAHKILSLARLPVPTLPHIAFHGNHCSLATNNSISNLWDNVNRFFIFFFHSFFILFSFFTETVRYLLCLILARDHKKSKAKSACTQRGVHLLLFKGISPGYFHAFMHISPPTVHALLSVSYTSIIHTKCHTGYLL